MNIGVSIASIATIVTTAADFLYFEVSLFSLPAACLPVGRVGRVGRAGRNLEVIPSFLRLSLQLNV
jgi:hypothetical protein